MRKRLILGMVAAALLLTIGICLEPTGVVLGWLHGETFYRHRPTRYWGKALASADPATRAETHRTLKEGGRAAAPVLAEILRTDPNAEARWKAADLLGQLGPEARESPVALAALTAALKDPDAHVRAIAVTALASVGPAGPDALPLLQEMLSTPDRLPALRALARYGPDALPAALQLMVLLQNDGDTEIRWNAARTLGKIGPAARGTVPILVEALDDRDALVREHAAEALGEIGPDAESAIPALVKVLKDPDARVRRDAVRSLGQIGPAAKSAAEDIRPLLKDREEKVRKAARTSLQQINPPATDKPS